MNHKHSRIINFLVAILLGVFSASSVNAALNITSTNPQKYATDVDRVIRPTITFSTNISPSTNYRSITLKDNWGNAVSGDVCLYENSVIFVPKEHLRSKEYYMLTIPNGALIDGNGNSNEEITLSFNVTEYGYSKIVQTDYYNFVKDDGTVWQWGQYDGKYWSPSPGKGNGLFPEQVLTDIAYFDLKGDWDGGYFVRNDKSLWGWGQNYYGDSYNPDNCILGDGTKLGRSIPVLIANDVERVNLTGWHHAILKTDKSLWLWGQNRSGQIGNGKYGTENYQLYPYMALTDVVDFDLAAWGTAAVKSDGSLWVWGSFITGDKVWSSSTSINPQKKLDNVVSVACGSTHMLAIKKDGTLWAWGKNEYGQVGDGSTEFVSFPTYVLSNVKKACASINHSAALRNDGTLWMWGSSNNGGIGKGQGYGSYTPVKIMDDVIDVCMNDMNVYVIKSDHSLWGWGDRICTSGTNYTPTKLLDDIDVSVRLKSGTSKIAVKKDGSVWVWGYYYPGNGTSGWQYTPTQIIAPQSKKQIEKVAFSSQAITIREGQRLPMQTSLSPLNVDLKSMSFRSEDESIVKVSENGILEGIKSGQTKVVVSATDDNGKEVAATCDVVVEMKDPDTDIALLSNAIYAMNINGNVGETVELRIRMKNKPSVTSYQFSLHLPEGVTVAPDPEDEDYYLMEVSGSRTTAKKHNTFDGSYAKDGSFLVTCASTSNAVFSGNDGEVATITLRIADDMEPGEYPICFKNCVITEAGTNKSVYPDDVKLTLVIEDYIAGDANGDGVVNISDYSAIISHIHGELSGEVNVKAMDVNGDGTVNISDASSIITLIHE